MSPRKEILADGVELWLGDCREVLPLLGKVDAVVTDPPYGIDAARKRESERFGWRDYGVDGWDSTRAPDEVMYVLLGLKVPTVIWGGNYYVDLLTAGTKWLIWDKGQSDFSLADAELAWCSFEGAIRRLSYSRSLAMLDGKEHPTQKALEVMKWCIDQIPPPAPKKILDPFMGSGTTGCAAVKLVRKFVGIERIPSFYDIAKRRITEALKQPDLFIEWPKPAKQEAFL